MNFGQMMYDAQRPQWTDAQQRDWDDYCDGVDVALNQLLESRARAAQNALLITRERVRACEQALDDAIVALDMSKRA